MEDVIERFPHIAKQVFEQMDNKCLTNCREVSKSWMNFIDERSFSWIRILSFPKVLRNGDTYLYLAARTGQTDIFKEIMTQEGYTNAKDRYGYRPFHHIS